MAYAKHVLNNMMYVYAIISVIIVSLLSLLGAGLLIFGRVHIQKFMSPLIALSSGVLLGSTFFDLIPESIELLPEQGFLFILIGIITFFSLEKLLNWHHHIDGDHPGESNAAGYLSLIGDAIHNFIDGVVIGSAFLVSIPLGISVTIAVIAHEIPHELADFSILLHSGFSNSKALLYNFLSAATAIFGTILVLTIHSLEHTLIPFLIPFAAGNFLYIAMSDLIPELHNKNSKLGSVVQILLLISGAMLIKMLPGHEH